MNPIKYRLTHPRLLAADSISGFVMLEFGVSVMIVARLGRIRIPDSNSKNPQNIKNLNLIKEMISSKLENFHEIRIMKIARDRCGRYICEVWVDQTNLSDMLIEAKLVGIFQNDFRASIQ